MKIWIDTEFNSYLGDFISIGLVDENEQTFYAAVKCDFPQTWVIDNVIPVINTNLTTMEELQANLEKFLSNYKTIHIVADWPEDISHFCKLLITGPGTRINTPPLTMEIKRNLDGAVSEIPHNALKDAFAIKKEDLRINSDTNQKEKNIHIDILKEINQKAENIYIDILKEIKKVIKKDKEV